MTTSTTSQMTEHEHALTQALLAGVASVCRRGGSDAELLDTLCRNYTAADTAEDTHRALPTNRILDSTFETAVALVVFGMADDMPGVASALTGAKLPAWAIAIVTGAR